MNWQSTEVAERGHKRWKRPGLSVAVCAAWWLALGPASVAGSWVEYREVGPFRLYAQFPLSKTGSLITDLRRLPDDLWQALRLPPSEEAIEVYLFRARSAYNRYVAANMPDAPQRRALFVRRPGLRRVLAYRNSQMETDVRHECTHALLHAALPMVPLWLDEGLATYFEVAPTERFRANPASRRALWDMRLGRMPSLARLEKVSNVGAFAAADYRAAWAWVHFMIHGPPEAQEALKTFLADIRARQPPGSLHARLRRGLPDADRRFEEHVRSQ